jgi:small-conductance mechanosensitive channel
LKAAYDAALRSKEDVAPAGREAGAKPVMPARGSVHRGRPTPRGVATSRPWYESLPATSQPTGLESQDVHRDFAVVDWLNRPNQFEGTPEQAKALAGRTAHALSILNERLRLDPAARNATTKRTLLQDRQRLAALSKALNSRSNRAIPPEPDPKMVEAEAARRKEFEKQMQVEQKVRAEELDKAGEQARKWQEEQDKKAAAKPGLFDWIKPKPPEETK